MSCPFLDSLSTSGQTPKPAKGGGHAELAALLTFQEPIAAPFIGHFTEVLDSPAAHYSQ